MTFDRNLGPKMKRLVIYKMSVDAVPSGGGVQSAIDFITSPEKMKTSAENAMAWARQAVQDIRNASDYSGDGDEESIAGMILQKLEERLAQQKLSRSRL